MPVKSKAQARYMGAVLSGSVKGSGLSKAQAKEFLEASKGNIKRLPEKVKKK